METIGKRVPPAVFLDTQVFVQQSFSFTTGLLAAFRERVQRGGLEYVTTDLTMREIRSQLGAAIDGAEAAFRRFQSQARALRSSRAPHIAQLFKPFNRRKVQRDLLVALHAYFDTVVPTILKVDEVPPSVVFDRFFNKQVPFHNPKKPSEFRDAFALEALRRYARATKRRIVIVTGDPDWEGDRPDDPDFQFTDRLEGVLQDTLELTPLLQAAQDSLKAVEGAVREAVAAQFCNLPFHVGDRDATVRDVAEVAVYPLKTYIAAVQADSVVFSMDLYVNFDASIDYQPQGVLRPDAPQLNRWRRYERPSVVASSESFNVTGVLTWTAGKASSASLHEVQITDSRDVVVFVEDFYSS